MSAASTVAPAAGPTLSSRFWRPAVVFPLALLMRVVLLAYGRWQDAHSPMKYTDIDYLVFTDAARFVARGSSPYDRATYRYTPLLAWLLLPTTWAGAGGWWFEAGKALFALGDLVAGALIFRILRTTARFGDRRQGGGSGRQGMPVDRALRFASIWLLNPMVANISTRGSSEGLVAVLVVALLWAALERRVALAGALLGFAVHFKIYPFIYAASIFWWLGDGGGRSATDASPFLSGRSTATGSGTRSSTKTVVAVLRNLGSRERVTLAVMSFATFMGLNLVMYRM
jgi:phosphatidylinositol glycan class M